MQIVYRFFNNENKQVVKLIRDGDMRQETAKKTWNIVILIVLSIVVITIALFTLMDPSDLNSKTYIIF